MSSVPGTRSAEDFSAPIICLGGVWPGTDLKVKPACCILVKQECFRVCAFHLSASRRSKVNRPVLCCLLASVAAVSIAVLRPASAAPGDAASKPVDFDREIRPIL